MRAFDVALPTEASTFTLVFAFLKSPLDRYRRTRLTSSRSCVSRSVMTENGVYNSHSSARGRVVLTINLPRFKLHGMSSFHPPNHLQSTHLTTRTEPVYRLAEKEWKDFIDAFTPLLVEVDGQLPHLPRKTSFIEFIAMCGLVMIRRRIRGGSQRASRGAGGRGSSRIVRHCLVFFCEFALTKYHRICYRSCVSQSFVCPSKLYLPAFLSFVLGRVS